MIISEFYDVFQIMAWVGGGEMQKLSFVDVVPSGFVKVGGKSKKLRGKSKKVGGKKSKKSTAVSGLRKKHLFYFSTKSVQLYQSKAIKKPQILGLQCLFSVIFM